MLYLAFNSLENPINDFPETVSIDARTQAEARQKFSESFPEYKTILSETSEEVAIALPDGSEVVFYGFTEE